MKQSLSRYRFAWRQLPRIRCAAPAQGSLWFSGKLQLENVILEQKAISRIEHGERLISDYELLAFAKVLKVSLSWLLTGKD